NGFKRWKIDQTLFIKKQKGDILLVQDYVDDIIFGSTNKELCTAFEKLMKDKFQMSYMGELTFFLGLQVKKKEDGIFISQDKYIAEILKKFNYTDVKSASTPVDLEKPLVKDGDANDVDIHLYRSMIGSLMYLTASRPNIMFAVCACAKFQVTPKTSHLLAIKRIFRYLKGKPTLGLWYSRDSPFELVAYTDSDYVGATQDRKSTTGGCQFLGNRLISWQCKKQIVVATSTTEAEYVATASFCGQVLWIQNQLLDYGYNFINTMIHIDNNSTICIIENPVQHSKIKHIEIRHHFIKDCNAKNLIQMVKINNDHNVADLLTKGFDAGRFQYLVSMLLEGNLVFLITVKIFKALTSFIVADEVIFISVDVNAGGAATTDIGLDVGQGSGIIHKTPTRLSDAPLLGVNTPGSAEGSLSQTELTDLVLKLSKKVEGLETELKNIKQIYEDFHFVTPTKISASGEAHSSDISPEGQLGVLSVAKILADAGKSDTVPKTVSEVQTYTRRRRDVIDVNTGSEAVNIASDFFSTAKDSVNNAGDSILVKDKDPGQREGKAVMELDERVEVVAKFNQAHDIDWSDPVVLRCHALQNRSFSVAEDQNHAFVPKDSEIEKEVMKRPGFDLQQESIKKNEKIKASVEQVVKESSKKVGGRLKRKVAKARDDKDKRQKMQDDLEKLTLMGADGSYKTYIYFSEMLNDFDREDLIVLSRLFKEKYASTRPCFDDLVLWGDMKIMFEPDGDDVV
ncbi:putative ribonuclease H-like domain-containing protein, partial [Tanacetum coccineum]